MKDNAAPQTAKSPLLTRAAGGLSGHTLRWPRLTAFLCSLLVAAVFILPFVLRREGILYVSNDQITQQMPFTQAIVKNLRAGNFLYDFNLDLGSGIIEGYAWYNLGSVFSLVLLLFPASLTPYLLGPMLILKFGAAGLFSFIWMRRYTRTDVAALCGSMLYAFCGVAISNMVFPFADVYALFPLLPLGMDMAVTDGKWGAFAAAVALNALVNPPLFVGAGVFMILYFGVKLFWRAYKWSWKGFLHVAAETLCGLLLSAFILLPFVCALAGNPRVEGGLLPFGKDWLFYNAYRYFEILRSLILPAEVIHANSMMLLSDAVSPEWYLPLFGMVPVFAWLLHKRRDWLRGLLLCSFVCMLAPVLNSAFSALNSTYYTRWLYMPVLAAALCTALWLEQAEEIPLKGAYLTWGALALAFAGCMVLWRFYYGYDTFITYLPAFIVNLAVCVAGLAATGFARRLWARLPRLICAGVALFAVVTGFFNLLFNQAEATASFGELTEIPANSIYAAETVPLPDGVYRINSPTSNVYFDHGSPFSFNSTVPRGVFDLQAAFGRQRTSASRIEYSEPGLWSLLGVKYLLMTPHDPVDALPGLTFYAEGDPFDIYENTDVLPPVIGFDATLDQDAVEKLDNTQKSIVMLHGLVLDAEGRAAFGELTGIPTDALAGLGYDEGVAARKAMSASNVALDSQAATVTAQIVLPTDGAALITIPYDDGWTCEVNGEATPITKADWGLMAVPCPAGESTLVLRYRSVGGVAGLALTGVGLVALALMLWLPRRKKKAAKAAG